MDASTRPRPSFSDVLKSPGALAASPLPPSYRIVTGIVDFQNYALSLRLPRSYRPAAAKSSRIVKFPCQIAGQLPHSYRPTTAQLPRNYRPTTATYRSSTASDGPPAASN